MQVALPMARLPIGWRLALFLESHLVGARLDALHYQVQAQQRVDGTKKISK
jgi:hypothetical protein